MDRRSKKRIAGLKTKLETLRKKLAGARAQEDEPGEVKALEVQIEAAQAEISRLKNG